MAIRWEPRNAIGVAVIDRPERRNALSAELCEQLSSLLAANRDSRVVVVTGAGDKAFCAGADIGRRTTDVGTLEHGGTDRFRPAFEELLDAIVAYPAPVVAAVNGAALGAGAQLAVACDLRVAAPSATFGIPAARLGVLVSAANIARLAQLVGQGPARDLLLTARTLDVDEAERIGLIQRRADNALDGALNLASELSGLAPLSVAGHKRALNLVTESQALLPRMAEEIRDLEQAAFESEDLQEGLTAFTDKRTPRFSGR